MKLFSTQVKQRKNTGIPTISIGIPAYNEEQNIINLLNLLLQQEAKTYHLQSILVISDGSSDATEKKVHLFSKEHPEVVLFADHRRKGKNIRLNELYKKNKSDILIILDADSIFKNHDALDLLIAPFADQEVVFTSVNKIPVKQKDFPGLLFYWWDELFHDAYASYNKGQNIYNFTSSGYAIRKDFSKTVKHKLHLISSGLFIYFTALRQQKKVVFVPEAVLLTRLPATVHEYRLLLSRTMKQKQYFVKYFGKWILPYYYIPKNYIRKHTVMYCIHHPLQSVITIIFHLMLFQFPYNEEQNIKKGIWETLTSSKKAIILNQ